MKMDIVLKTWKQIKAAAPAERHYNAEHAFTGRRPNQLLLQRDSDANKCVDASRTAALDKHASLKVQTGSELLPQFHSSYFPRVFPFTLSVLSSGPDFRSTDRDPHHQPAAPPWLGLGAYAAAMARQAPAQIRWDWAFLPAVQSLNFVSTVNKSTGLGFLRRQYKAGQDEGNVGQSICTRTAKLVRLLHEGEYTKPDGSRAAINGDTRLWPYAVGLTEQDKFILKQYMYVTEKLAGTRQVRQHIGHFPEQCLHRVRIAYFRNTHTK